MIMISRWQRLEERRNRVRAFWLMAGTVLIIGLVIFFGFNLLTKMFLFIGNLNSANRPVEKTDFIPPSPPQFFPTVEATNSAVLSLQGMAEAGSTVYLTQNSGEVGNTVTPDNGIFDFSSLRLKDGNNQFQAVAVDLAGNRSQTSLTLDVFYSNKPPELKITSPADKQIVTGSDPKIEIDGTTDPEARLIINDRVVIVGSDGKFSYSLVLNSGDNALHILASDKNGNQSKKEMTVTYNP